MEKLVFFPTTMNEPYRDHPDEEALERFLLNRSDEEELEIVETHIMACEGCVEKLEALEYQITATKIALKSHVTERCASIAHQQTESRFGNWLTLTRFSLAGGAVAACALVLTVVSIPRQENISAYRGAEVTNVAAWTPLSLHLDANDLPPGSVAVEVVDARGGKIWQGAATNANDQIDVDIPRLKSSRHYLVRVYSTQDDALGALLREYSMQTKPLF